MSRDKDIETVELYQVITPDGTVVTAFMQDGEPKILNISDPGQVCVLKAVK